MSKIITYRCQSCDIAFVREMIEGSPLPRCPRCQGKKVLQR